MFHKTWYWYYEPKDLCYSVCWALKLVVAKNQLQFQAVKQTVLLIAVVRREQSTYYQLIQQKEDS